MIVPPTPYPIPSRCGNADVSCQIKDPNNRWVCSRCPMWAALSGRALDDTITTSPKGES